jgi:uncharacterized protein (DUF2147 family)
MKRFAGLMVLMALSTPAYAGSYSFVIGGHHIHVEASRHCRSLSCVSWSGITRKRDRDDTVAANSDPAPAQTPIATAAPATIAPPSIAAPAAPAPAPAPPAPIAARPAPPVQTQPAPVQQQASALPALKPVETRTVVTTPPAPPPAKIDPPAPVVQVPAVQVPAVQVPAVQVPAAQPKPDVKVEAKVEPKVEPKVDANAEAKPRVGFDLRPEARLEPKVEIKVEAKVEPKVEREQKVDTKVEQKTDTRPDAKPDTKPDTTASVAKTPEKQVDKPAVVARPAPSKTTLQSPGEAIEAPIGDWQTEGRKGLVRIEPCGTALCGYMINVSTNAKGETVLINMKPKANSEWSGSIYSRASGNTYYATMTVKRPNTLRVEACVVGHYFCSGNNWTRIAPKPDDMIAPRETREASADPAR